MLVVALHLAAALPPRLVDTTRAARRLALAHVRLSRAGVYAAPDPHTTWYLWPQETGCHGIGDGNIARIGSLEPDRSKWVCSPHSYRGSACLTYSFGGAAEYEWDIGMTAATGCEHHIFDPTAPCMLSDGPAACTSYAEAHGPALVADHNVTSYTEVGISNRNKTLRWFSHDVRVAALPDLMAAKGHAGRQIDFLKLDVEGAEFDVVRSLFGGAEPTVRVAQLLIEVHWPMNRPEFARLEPHLRTSAFHDTFFAHLETAGFEIAHVEFNSACGFNCVEFLWINRDVHPAAY